MSDDALYDRIAGIYDPWSRSVTEDVELLRRGGDGLGRAGRRARRGHGADRRPGGTRGRARDRGRRVARDARAGPGVRRARGGRRTSSTCASATCGSRPSPSASRWSPSLSARSSTWRTRSRSSARSPPRRRCSSPTAGSSSTCSRRARRTSRRRDGLGSSGSPASSSARTGTLARGRSTLSVRSPSTRRRWSCTGSRRRSGITSIEQAGLEADDLYGWFDRRPYDGGEDQIWVCRRAALTLRAADSGHGLRLRARPRRPPARPRLEHLRVDAETGLAVDRAAASSSSRRTSRSRRPCPGSPREPRSEASERRRAASPRRPVPDDRATAPPRARRARRARAASGNGARPRRSGRRDARETSVAGRESVAQAPSSRSTSVSERPTRSDSASAHGPSTDVSSRPPVRTPSRPSAPSARPRPRAAPRREASPRAASNPDPTSPMRARASCPACRCRAGGASSTRRKRLSSRAPSGPSTIAVRMVQAKALDGRDVDPGDARAGHREGRCYRGRWTRPSRAA